MSAPQSIKETLVWTKTELLVEHVLELIDTLPSSEIYGLDSKLRMSISQIPLNIDESFKQNTRMDRIRSIIKANGFIDECNDWLKMVQSMKYAYTLDLLEELEEVKLLINSTNPVRYGKLA